MKQLNMKTLSTRQPWAHAILHLGKDCENRTWNTNFRGNFLLHASKKINKDMLSRLCVRPDELSTGAIVGMANLYEVIHKNHQNEIVDSQGMRVNDVSEWYWEDMSDRVVYGFMLKDTVAFKNPIPCTGNLSFFTPPEEVLRKVQNEVFSLPA